MTAFVTSTFVPFSYESICLHLYPIRQQNSPRKRGQVVQPLKLPDAAVPLKVPQSPLINHHFFIKCDNCHPQGGAPVR